jgi:hypothetical protein
MRTWRTFYVVTYTMIGIIGLAVFAAPNKTITAIALIICQIIYTPFVLIEFRRSLKRKKKGEREID